MSKLYQVHEFAELAGVTVRTLHHYDRIGLLCPRRTDAGYRLYALHDMERLEQIVALKFLGLPLKRIKAVLLGRDALPLPDALRLQRRVLEEKRRLLDRAIRAIEDAEKGADTAVLKKIIEVIGMQDNIEVMKKYYTEEAWTKWAQRRYRSGPSQEWIDLYCEAADSLGEDPAGEKAQALLKRWLELAERDSGGDADMKAGWIKAWADREHWPSALQQQVAELDIEKAAEFMTKAIGSYRKKYYTEEAWARLTERQKQLGSQASVAWSELIGEVAASLGEDPAGEKAQALANRWLELVERDTGADADIKAGGIKAWADRKNWPAPMQPSLNYEKVAEFIGKALAWRSSEARRRSSLE